MASARGEPLSARQKTRGPARGPGAQESIWVVGLACGAVALELIAMASGGHWPMTVTKWGVP